MTRVRNVCDTRAFVKLPLVGTVYGTCVVGRGRVHIPSLTCM